MNNKIPIFDSLLHPTLDGGWIGEREPLTASIDSLLLEMAQNNISKGLAVGLGGIGGYNEIKFIDFIKSNSDNLIPIAFFDVNSANSIIEIKSKLSFLRKIGYKGIKLHPRIGGFNLDHPLLPSVIKEANDLQLAVLLCTYFYSSAPFSHLNNFTMLSSLMEKISSEKIILMHGGGVRLMEYSELVRNFPHTLLDLSFTILKYAGSSIDFDLEYLFTKFDRRICIGSDSPEFKLHDLRMRFNKLSKNCTDLQAHNIAFQNLERFINS
jgi:predicted TIM-barrel fold metal-dependent hydrolase